MSLANLQLRSATVPYNGTDITVYGLSANDLAGLIANQMSAMEQVFDIIEGAGVKSAEDLSNVNVAELGQTLLTQAPGFIAAAIAYAAREPEFEHNVLHLPAPVQVELLKEIAQLTFNDVAGFRQFVGNVIAALRSAKGVVPQASNEASRALNGSQTGGSASEQPSLSS